MMPENDGIYLAANPETFALGSTLNIKPDFLSKSVKFAAPEVVEFLHVFTGTVSAVTGGALGADAAKLLKRVILTDDDEFYNLPGASMRVLDQMDFGGLSTDPADVTSGATSSSYVFVLRQSFTPPKMERPRDFAIPAINFLEGNSIQISFADALMTGWSAATLTYRLWARVVDGRVNELKSRRKVYQTAFNRDDEFYPTNDAFLRALILTSTLTTTGYTTLAGITALNSTNLELFPDFPASLARDRYRRFAWVTPGSNDEFLASAPGAIAFVQPDRNQRIGAMPKLPSAHLRLGSTPTSAQLIRDVLVPRPVEISSKQMGYRGNVGGYQLALLNQGKIVNARGESTDVSKWPEALARVMPIRIPGREKMFG